MRTYDLMKDYARLKRIPPADSLPCPELGQSLSLFHTCLLEAGLQRDESSGTPLLIAHPDDIRPNHLSRFVVGFLPFNSITSQAETNNILFEVYFFFKWLEKRDLQHGLDNIDFPSLLKNLSSAQERCLKLSHYLDEETGRVLKDPPPIVDTVNDFFSVIKIEKSFVYLQGRKTEDPIRLKLPGPAMDMIRVDDNLDLVLGDTSERWVLLEAGQVFPKG